MFCPSCGTESVPGQKFCRNCGATLGAAGSEPTPALVDSGQIPASVAPAVPPPHPAPAPYAPPPVLTPYPQAEPPYPAQYPPPVSMSYPQPPPGTPPAMYQPYPGAQQQLYYASAPQIPYRLFDSGAVLLATFFGSPLAGAIVMAVNYGRLGKSGKAFLAVVLGLAATALLVEIGLSGKTQYSPLGIVFLLATWQIARMTQGKDVQEHTARGGQLGSKWTAFFIALATLAALFGVVVYAIATNQIQVPGTPNQNSKNFVTIGTKDQVIYSGTATKADATALGNALKADGYFQDRGVTVQIDKGSSGTTISFAIQDGAWNQTSTLSSFEEIVREVAPSVGGFPVQLDLDDSKMDVEKTSTVGEVTFDGGDAVYYEGSATQAQAQALGQQFKSISFFTGKGANVVLTKHDDGATLAFVVADGTWNNPTMVSAFETITRSVASTSAVCPLTCVWSTHRCRSRRMKS